MSTSHSDNQMRVMSNTNDTSSSQSDPLHTILERLNGSVANVTKLRLFLSDLEKELNEIHQQCENELYARMSTVAAEKAVVQDRERIAKQTDELGSEQKCNRNLVKENPELSMKIESRSRSAVSPPILGLPLSGGLGSPSGVVKGGNSLGLMAVSPSWFRTVAAKAQVQDGGSRVSTHGHAKEPLIAKQIPLRDRARPPTHPSPFPKDLDPASYPPQLKREGHDWFILFNPSSKVKQVLDLNMVHQLVHDSPVQCVQFSRDEKWLATGCRRTAQIYDMRTGVTTCILDHANDTYIWNVCFSPDGKYLATAADDKQIRIWNIAGKQIYKIFKGYQGFTYSYCLQFLPSGRSIISGSSDGSVYIWNMHDNMFKVLTVHDHYPPHGHHHGVLSVAISPDGRYIGVGSANTVVSIWEIATGVLVERLRGHKDCVYCVTFTPDGKGLISGGSDEMLKYWDISRLGIGSDVTGTALTRTSSTFSSPCLMNLTGHGDYYVRSTVISHDGTWVISGSKDRNVLFWETRTGVVQCLLSGHKDSVIQVDLSSKGNFLATASDDFQARIWSYRVPG